MEPRDFPVSLLQIRSTQRRASALAIGQVRPSGHPIPVVGNPSATFFGMAPEGRRYLKELLPVSVSVHRLH